MIWAIRIVPMLQRHGTQVRLGMNSHTERGGNYKQSAEKK